MFHPPVPASDQSSAEPFPKPVEHRAGSGHNGGISGIGKVGMMADISIPYTFDGASKTISATTGDPRKPLVLLLHGTGGRIDDMTDPVGPSGPDSHYDYSGPFPSDRTIGWRDYPGVGVWSFTLDQMKPKDQIKSWQQILEEHNFPTAAYSQVDNVGLLQRPSDELAVIFAAIAKQPEFAESRIVLIAHSRGGLLARKFLKDHQDLASRVSKLITLHAPHLGSQLANVANTLKDAIEGLESVFGSIVTEALGGLLDVVDSPAYQELAIGSPFLTDLANGETALQEIEYYTFGGTSPLLTRLLSWVYTLGSAIPQWHLPPFHHRITLAEIPVASPVLNSLPDLADEIAEGKGDILVADSRAHLDFSVRQTNSLNHAEALWDPTLQAQVLRILGEDIVIWA
jgi:pimeloyl-ACP methyl ester carboxylesterase